MSNGLTRHIFICFIGLIFSQCETARPKHLMGVVQLPIMYSSASECYFLDEFMPTPDYLVKGRSNGLYIRYYTYRKVLYKLWSEKDIELSFYSKDDECWSLFSEKLISFND